MCKKIIELSRMRKKTFEITLLVLLMLMLFLVGIGTYKSLAEDMFSEVYDNAWKDAVDLSGFNGLITKSRPETRLLTMRYDLHDGLRKFAECRPVWELDKNGHFVCRVIVFVYLDAHEVKKLLHRVCVHEYLHILWLRNCLVDPDFCERNPDTEKWVRSILPSVQK